MDPLSNNQITKYERVINSLTAEEQQAQEEKNLAISKIAQETRELQKKQALELQKKVFEAPEGMQQYMFAHMPTESLIELSKITNPDTHSLEPIATSVRLFAVNEFNKKFNKEALLANNKAVLLQVENKAKTADILLSIELNEGKEELAPYIINHEDSQFVNAEATETHLKNLQVSVRTELLQNPNTYKYPFIVQLFRTHFKDEYEDGLRHIYNNHNSNLLSLNEALQKNEDFMRIVAEPNGLALQYAHEQFLQNRDIVLAAVMYNPLPLPHDDTIFRRLVSYV